jgi:hypothetical protein
MTGSSHNFDLLVEHRCNSLIYLTFIIVGFCWLRSLLSVSDLESNQPILLKMVMMVGLCRVFPGFYYGRVHALWKEWIFIYFFQLKFVLIWNFLGIRMLHFSSLWPFTRQRAQRQYCAWRVWKNSNTGTVTVILCAKQPHFQRMDLLSSFPPNLLYNLCNFFLPAGLRAFFASILTMCLSKTHVR